MFGTNAWPRSDLSDKGGQESRKPYKSARLGWTGIVPVINGTRLREGNALKRTKGEVFPGASPILFGVQKCKG